MLNYTYEDIKKMSKEEQDKLHSQVLKAVAEGSVKVQETLEGLERTAHTVCNRTK